MKTAEEIAQETQKELQALNEQGLALSMAFQSYRNRVDALTYAVTQLQYARHGILPPPPEEVATVQKIVGGWPE